MTYMWIDEIAALPEALLQADTWYLDTEFMRERTFWAQLALVQVAAAGKLILLDASRLVDMEPLGRLLASKQLVLHASSEDLEVLTHATGVAPVRAEDTQLAAALTGLPLQLSYQKLVQEVCGVTLPKDATRSDWLQRPLTKQQLDYAADDVRYLAQVREQLAQKLETQGRRDWWREECARLLQQVLTETPARDCWRQVKGAANLQGRELARLQQLAAWRDGEARAQDKPRSFILHDELLMVLAQRAPTRSVQLAALGLPPGLVRRQGEELMEQLASAERLPIPASLPGPLDGEQKNIFKRLKQVAEQVARELGLEVDVLARRRWLESLVRQPDHVPEPLTGWRRDVLTNKLLASI